MMLSALFITLDLWYIIWVVSLRIKLPESFSLPIMAAFCGIFKYLNERVAIETGISLTQPIVPPTEQNLLTSDKKDPQSNKKE